jgi:Protein of unknown function (DUF1360)
MTDVGTTDAGVQSLPPFAGHSPDRPRPLGGYAAVIGLYGALTGGFAAWMKRSGRTAPEQIDTRDLALMTLATHKLTRLIARDRVTSVVRAPFTRFQDDGGPGEVDEAARGSGLQRTLGELLVCPYCLSMWTATAFVAGHLVAPRATRLISSTFAVLAGSDLLQIGYAKAGSTL